MPVSRLMQRLLAALGPPRRYPIAVRYGATALIVAGAFLLRLALQEYMKGYPTLLFIPAIFLSALLFDRGAGFFATSLSVVLAQYFFISPVYSFKVDQEHILALSIFAGIGVLISMVTETLRYTIDKHASAEKEKTLLLEELAHRTKNDLALISSVLSLQAKSSANADVRAALQAAIARVTVIVKAQERLDKVKAGGTIEAGTYLEALCKGLGDLLRDVRPITVSVEADQIELGASQAVSIGLIANELVTNSFKYAFPGGCGGTVEVGFKRKDATVILTVADNGIGCTSGRMPGQGSRLVRLITEQWDGTLDYGSQDGGCRVTVLLPIAAPSPPE